VGDPAVPVVEEEADGVERALLLVGNDRVEVVPPCRRRSVEDHRGDGARHERDVHESVEFGGEDETLDVALHERLHRGTVELPTTAGIDEHEEIAVVPGRRLSAPQHGTGERDARDAIGEDADGVGLLGLEAAREEVGDVAHLVRGSADPFGDVDVHATAVAVVEDERDGRRGDAHMLGDVLQCQHRQPPSNV
jgi:hypothetical protein